MRIQTWLVLAAWCVVSIALAQGSPPSTPGSRYAGTWRTENGSLQLRINDEGAVEAFITGDGKRVRGQMIASSRRGASVLLESGEVLSLGPGSTPDTLQGGIDTRLFTLLPMAPEQFGRMAAAPRSGAAAAGGGSAGSLAGVKLHRVSTGNNSGSESIYWFCGNGRYRHTWQSLSGGSMLGASEEAGVWRQSGMQVQLQSRSGSEVLTLRPVSERKVEVNGKDYVVGPSGC
ncbi:MAG: hypothetical protein ACRC2B_24380 [Rubrivivax sp.]